MGFSQAQVDFIRKQPGYENFNPNGYMPAGMEGALKSAPGMPPDEGTPTPGNQGVGNDPGINSSSVDTSQPGIGGVLGMKSRDYTVVSPVTQNDPNYDANKAALAQHIADAGNMATPQMQAAKVASAAQATASTATAGALPTDTRTGQMKLAGQLADQAEGKGPTLAQQRFKENTDRGMAQALAMAASARGVNPALAMRQAADSQVQIQGQAAQQSADLSQQEQMNARGQLAGVLSGVAGQDQGARAQDIGLSEFNAGQATDTSKFNATATNTAAAQQAALDQAAAAANMGGQIDMEKYKSALVQSYVQMGMSLDQANYQAQLQQEQYKAGLLAQQIAASHNVSIQNSAQGAQLAGAAMSAGGAALASALAPSTAAAAGAGAGAAAGANLGEAALMAI
jgi:hypothetical protein